MKFRIEQVLEIRKRLEALPELPSESHDFVNAREAVGLLSETIKQLHTKGYSKQNIAILLREQGVELSLVTLRQYLTSVMVKPGRQKRPAAKRSKAKTPEGNARVHARTPAKPAKEAPPKGGFAVRGDTDEL